MHIFDLFIFFLIYIFFSRMCSEGSRFAWGSGGEAVFAKSCICDRNRSQPFATVRNRLRDRRKGLERSRNRVKLIRVAAVVLAFAEEVSV